MLKFLFRIRWGLGAVGFLMLVAAAPSFASGAHPGPDWRDVALAALGLVSALVSGWAGAMQLAIVRMNRQLGETRELVIGGYQTREDMKDQVRAGVQEAINPLRVRMARIEAGLEARGFLAPSHHGDMHHD